MDTKTSSKNSISIDLRVICLLLLVIIAGMLAFWRPWESKPSEARKITITGESTIKAEPDEFAFYPYFERTGADQDKLKTELNDFGKKLLDDVKKLGVKEEDVTLDSSAYDRYYYPIEGGNTNENKTITLSVQINASNKDLAQKVQDYLSKTDAKGQLTSQPSFSKDKVKQLEGEARQKAIKEAREKADQTASGLGAKIGKVLAVNDQQNNGFIGLYGAKNTLAAAEGDSSSSLPVTPGKQEVSYSVEVVFELL